MSSLHVESGIGEVGMRILFSSVLFCSLRLSGVCFQC
jgi:hypothetical protein